MVLGEAELDDAGGVVGRVVGVVGAAAEAGVVEGLVVPSAAAHERAAAPPCCCRAVSSRGRSSSWKFLVVGARRPCRIGGGAASTRACGVARRGVEGGRDWVGLAWRGNSGVWGWERVGADWGGWPRRGRRVWRVAGSDETAAAVIPLGSGMA